MQIRFALSRLVTPKSSLPRLAALICVLLAFAEPAAAEYYSESTTSDEPPEEVDNGGPGFGLYLDALGMMMFSPTGTSHEWDEACPDVGITPNPPECTTRAPIGFMLEGRLGFRFGYIALEGIALFAGDWSKASLDESLTVNLPEIGQSMQIGRVGGGLGGGLRFMTAPKAIRATLGVGAGVMFRHVYTNYTSLDGSSTGCQAPFLQADVNIILFHFLSLGVMGLIEFQDSFSVSPDLGMLPPGTPGVPELSNVVLYEGNQFFFGPVVGFHFGG